MLIIASIAVIFRSNPKVLLILHSVDQGFAALEENRIEEASNHLQKALDAYNTYHIQHPGLWWKRDTKIFISMLKSTQGWRKLGDFRQGLLTFESVAAHNSEGLNSWVGVQMESDMMEFINSSHWTDEQIASMNSFIQKMPLSSWGDQALLLIRASERVGLNVVSMKERLEDLDFLIYGVPKPMTTRGDDKLNVDAIRYYYIDRKIAFETVALPDSLPAYVRERLFWYSRVNRECLVFVKNPDQPTIQSLNDILLSESRNVEEFNRFYRE
ncbi:MAG: hypothetical protein JXR73_12720 [Candidatus Omnitrophica bacterium]|nr:hypothetical protein [Candidatus Omnitrophota bacterium]